MSRVSVEDLARSFRERLLDYRATGQRVSDATLETNTSRLAVRGGLLERALAARGFESLHGRAVLDVGAGFGAIAAYLALRGALVTAVEPNPRTVAVGRDVAAMHDLPISWVAARAERLTPLPRASFDIVVCNNMLEYLVPTAIRRAALREVARVTASGGLVLVHDPNRWHPLDQFTGLPLLQLLPPDTAARVAAGLGRRRPAVSLVSPVGMRRSLRAAGFDDVQPFHPQAPRPLRLFVRRLVMTARRP